MLAISQPAKADTLTLKTALVDGQLNLGQAALKSDRTITISLDLNLKINGPREPKLILELADARQFVFGALNKAGLELADSPVSAEKLGGMVARIVDNTISGKIAKQVFGFMWDEGKTADEIIAEKGLKQETDTGAIEAIIKDVLAANEKMVEEFKSGKEKAFNGLVGQVMKASKGKANPAQVNELMKKLIG